MAIVHKVERSSLTSGGPVYMTPKQLEQRDLALSVHEFAQKRLAIQPWQALGFSGTAYLAALMSGSPKTRALGVIFSIPVFLAGSYWSANLVVGDLAASRVKQIEDMASTTKDSGDSLRERQ